MQPSKPTAGIDAEQNDHDEEKYIEGSLGDGNIRDDQNQKHDREH